VQPLHSSRAGGTKLLNAIFLAIPVIAMVFGLEALSTSSPDTAVIWIAILVILVSFGCIRLILPDRYDVYADRLRLVFPLWGWNLPFVTIREVRLSRWWEPFASLGFRFATSPGQAVVIRRVGSGWLTGTIVISPDNREAFLGAFEPIFARYKASQHR
jgi:hypothetical protein